jgi:hypothetical protein
MRIGRRFVAGLFAAMILLPVPAFAIQKSAAKAKRQVTVKRQATIKQTGESATSIILHQYDERRTYVAISQAIRNQFRGAGPLLNASVQRYIRDLLLDLRAHWRIERRTGVVSPFEFPDV